MSPPRRPPASPCPGACGAHRPANQPACAACLNRCPTELRDRLSAAEHNRHRAAWADAVAEVRDWLLDNPDPDPDPDAAIADRCNFCREPILWLTTAATGSRMPVNRWPDPDRGNVVRSDGKAGVLGADQAKAARAAGVELWLHHVVDCPYARQWNRPKSTTTRKPVRRG